MLRFRLEGPRPCINVCFAFIHNADICTNYLTSTFLLVSSSVRSKQLLCFVQGQGQKREQKPTTKTFVEFHNHSPLLTMMYLSCQKFSVLMQRFILACFSSSSSFLLLCALYCSSIVSIMSKTLLS